MNGVLLNEKQSFSLEQLMPRMKVLAPHVFAGKPVKRGDEYEATDNEAIIVAGLGWSEYKTADLRAEPKADPKPRQRRQYRRKDLTASA